MARVISDHAGGYRQLEVSAGVDSMLDRMAAAFATNTTYLGRGSPTVAQNTAQIQALTRQVNALLRLALGQLNDTSDT